MRTAQQTRIKNKLELWNTLGFLQFIEDLNTMKGVECGIKQEVQSLRNLYIKELRFLAPESKYVQLKLKGL